MNKLASLTAVVFVYALAVPTAAQVSGDCNGDGSTTVDELLASLNVERGLRSSQPCQASGSVDEDAAVNAALFAPAVPDTEVSAARVMQGAPGAVTIDIGSAAGAPGQQVTFAVTIDTGGLRVAGMQNDTTFDPSTAVAATGTGAPDCTPMSVFDFGGFAFHPSSIRAVLLSFSLTPIPTGATVYACRVNIAPTAPTGTYPLVCSNAITSDPSGNRLPTTCTNGAIIVTSPQPPSAPAPDSFQCYNTFLLSPPAAAAPVNLIDQYGTMTSTVQNPRSLCAPTSVNGQDPEVPSHAAYLQSYSFYGRHGKFTARAPRQHQQVVDQFGTHTLDLSRPEQLLVPTAEALSAQPDPLALTLLDHFTCYGARPSKGSSEFQQIVTTVADSFGLSQTIKLLRPSRLCVPTDKNGEAVGAENHPWRLMCYRATGPYRSIGWVQANNEFGPSSVYLRYREELCVAAFTPAPPAPTPTPTPALTATATPTLTATATITPGGPPVCILAGATGAVIASRNFVLNAPLSGWQAWRFEAVQPDATRQVVILPSESHFDCSSVSLVGQSLRFCTRLDATTYCHGGSNDGRQCPPADCGAGNPCDITPAQGVVDCASGGGSITGYDSHVQVDHNTNDATVGGQPNKGLPAICVGGSRDGDTCSTWDPSADCPGGTCQAQTGAGDPSCSAGFTPAEGAVLSSCLEGGGADCSAPFNTHIGACNSPTEQTLSGASPAGGVRFRETINLSIGFATCADTWCFCGVGTCIGGPTPGAQCGVSGDCGAGGTCLTNNYARCTIDGDCYGSVSAGVCGVCPPDSCPLQTGEFQLSGIISSGFSKGVVWNANDTALTIGTTGPGNGANICGQVIGGPACPTTATGAPIDLTDLGGDCLAAPPATLSGATVAVIYPRIGDMDQTIGDFVATVKLQCQ